MLLWVPFYYQPEGVLPLLKKITHVVTQNHISSPDITNCLHTISRKLKDIKKIELIEEVQNRRLFEEVRNCELLIAQWEKQKKSFFTFRKTMQSINQLDGEPESEELINLITSNSLLQEFVRELTP